MRVIKILSILLFSITLASCGGGGCGATTAFGAIAYSACDKSEENPFQKYFGTWYFCEENIKNLRFDYFWAEIFKIMAARIALATEATKTLKIAKS